MVTHLEPNCKLISEGVNNKLIPGVGENRYWGHGWHDMRKVKYLIGKLFCFFVLFFVYNIRTKGEL